MIFKLMYFGDDFQMTQTFRERADSIQDLLCFAADCGIQFVEIHSTYERDACTQDVAFRNNNNDYSLILTWWMQPKGMCLLAVSRHRPLSSGN